MKIRRETDSEIFNVQEGGKLGDHDIPKERGVLRQ